MHPKGEFSLGSMEEISSCQELLTYLTDIPPNTDNQYSDNCNIDRLLYLPAVYCLSVQILCIIDRAAIIILLSLKFYDTPQNLSIVQQCLVLCMHVVHVFAYQHHLDRMHD